MTCTAPIFVGDVGTIFRLTVQECINDVLTIVDISAATALEFRFKKPDASVLTKTPIFTTDGTDGQLQYASIVGDLDQAGVWELQGKVTLPGGVYNTSIVTFDVDAVV